MPFHGNLLEFSSWLGDLAVKAVFLVFSVSERGFTLWTKCMQLSELCILEEANNFTVQDQMWSNVLTKSRVTRSSANFPDQFLNCLC